MKKQRVSGTAEAIARDLPETAWTRLWAGEATKGARLHDWHDIPPADLDAWSFTLKSAAARPAREHGTCSYGATSPTD